MDDLDAFVAQLLGHEAVGEIGTTDVVACITGNFSKRSNTDATESRKVDMHRGSIPLGEVYYSARRVMA